MSSPDRTITRGSAPKQVANNAKNEQPRSHHNEGIGSKTCCKQIQKMSSQDRTITRGLAPKQVANNAKIEQPRSHHNEGISILKGQFDQYLNRLAVPVGEDLGRGKDLSYIL